MNCKPGDLAIYVGKTSPLDVGAIVRCVEFVGIQKVVGSEMRLPMWRGDPPIANSMASRPWVADCALRPIRDQPGEDETIQWAGKPQEERA